MKVSKKATAFLLAAVLLVSSLFTAAPTIFAAEGETHGNFVISGGTYGVDYEYVTGTSPIQIQGYGTNESYNTTYHTPKSGGVINVAMDVLKIYTSTPLTISTNGTSSAGIQIEKGVQADLTFDNVTINALIPVNIVPNVKERNSWGRPLVENADTNGNGTPDYLENLSDLYNKVRQAEDVDANGDGIIDYLENPTSLHLTLADGSVNTLTAKLTSYTYQFPGLRCGEGSKLTIDDGRRNIDTDGNFVAPEQGRVSRDATLLDGTEVKKGDRLTLLDSENPGTLTVNGGYRASAIGGSALESSGDMTFNGGKIITRAYGVPESLSGYGPGAGIGGGHAGCGTTMTFNGGTIDSVGSYHGAGIGGGCTYGGGMSRSTVTYALTDGYLSQFPLSTIAGDININGGYLKSVGCTHSNAFGQACGGTNTGKTITITGGTLLPSSVSGWYDIGGAGGDVIVTGGSVRLTGGSASKFQSNGGVAWGDLDKTIKVFMTTINMAAYNKSNMLVDGMKITVNGIPSTYGMPSYTDESGNLYFWLPNTEDGSAPEVRVDLDLKDQDGEEVVTEPFFITNATQGAVLKQYVVFNIDESLITDENRLRKRYDGLAFTDAQQTAFLNSVVKDGIAVTAPANKLLTNVSAMTIQSQRLTEDLEVDDSEAITSGTNANVGKYQLTITSSEYANTAGFKDAFWGHRCYYKYAEITPADSKSTISVAPVSEDIAVSDTYDADTALELTAYVAAADNEATTCAAPTGKVQFYVNGKAYGDPVSLTECADTDETNATGHKQSVAKINWTPTQNGGKFAVDGKQEIYAKYIVQDKDNYNGSETEKANFNLTTVDQGKEEIGGKPIEITDDTDGTVIPADNSELEKIYGDKFTLTLDGGDTDEKPVYTSSNPEVAVVDEDGNVTIVGVGEAVITATRPGNGAYNSQSQDITITAKKKELTISSVDILDKYYNGSTNAKYNPDSVVIGGIVAGDEEKVKASLKGTAEFPKADVGLYPDAFVTFVLGEDIAANYFLKQADGSEGDSIVLTDEASIKIKSITPGGGNEGTTTPGGDEGTTTPGGDEGTTTPGGDEGTTSPGGAEGTTTPGGTTDPDDTNVYVESLSDMVWNGSAIIQYPVVKDGNRVLIKDVDYTVEFKNNIDVGTADVIIKGIGNYEGTLSTTFNITPPPTKVIINYCINDGSGKTLADEVVIDGYMGDAYSTAQYTRDDFYGYQLVEMPENVTGTMTDKAIYVNYYYALKGTKVIVNYIDENGTSVAPSKVIEGKVFDAFETHRLDIEGYNLIDINDNITSKTKAFFRNIAVALFDDKALTDVSGEMTEETIIVNYIYTLKDATVVSKYVDESGKELADSETQDLKYFDKYTTDAKDIKGYTLKDASSNAAGEVRADETVVTYTYALKNSDVVVSFVDENGKEIAQSVTLEGKYFESYATYPKEIVGYELVSSENEKGTRDEDVVNVTYTYKLKNASVLVKHVDENGNVLESETIDGKVFDSYSVSAKDIYEYMLVSSTNTVSGNMTEDDITVVFTYKKVLNIDTDGDGKPDINIDPDGDGKPDINIDPDGDGKPDINIDTDDDGKPDINIDTDDDGKPDINIDTDDDGKPDVNIDTDDDGKPDVNIDTDGDGKPDINIDTDGDGKPDINIDTDGDGKPDINIDTDGDGKPDINIDTDGDGKPDINIDTDGDGKADINIDTNNDGKADINIDTNNDNKADINLDLDGDGIADANIDTNGDGIADKNIIGAENSADAVDTGSTDMFTLIMFAAIAFAAAFAIILLLRKNKKEA